jgi:Glycosyltransferase WbsX
MKQLREVEYADAYAEFPPNIGSLWHSYGYTKWNHTDDYHLGMTLHFDNTPRRARGNPIRLPKTLSKNRTLPHKQPTPQEFRERCISRVQSWYKRTKEEKAVLFFAWNEWSEQAALEPNHLDGYGYLEAIRDCRLSISNLEVPPSLDTGSLPSSLHN